MIASQSPLSPSICLCHHGHQRWHGEKHPSVNREERTSVAEETNVRLHASGARLCTCFCCLIFCREQCGGSWSVHIWCPVWGHILGFAYKGLVWTHWIRLCCVPTKIALCLCVGFVCDLCARHQWFIIVRLPRPVWLPDRVGRGLFAGYQCLFY